METTDHSYKIKSEILQSSSLYLKEFEATEELDLKQRSFFGGTRIKAVLTPLLYWSIQHTPKAIALLPVYLIVLMLRFLYIVPKNPFRQACEHVCSLANKAGFQHKPKQVYWQLLNNFLNTTSAYFDLYRHGVESVADRIEISDSDAQKISDLAEKHGGVVLMVPHNFASVFSAIKLNILFNLLIVSRNSPTIDRTKAAIDFFERMNVTVLLVRGGNPFELSRTLFSELKKKTVVAATVDSVVHNSPITVKIFGQDVGFAPWAAKIATKKRIPIVPSYFRSSGRNMVATFGDPIISSDVNEAMQYYASFFENQILNDPANWAYLGDKRWCKILKKAASEH